MKGEALTRAFGLHWQSDIALREHAPATRAHQPDIVVSHAVSRAAPPAQHRTLHAGGVKLAYPGEPVIDVRGQDRIHLVAAPGWHGGVPQHFYGTAVAALLAARGLTPMHGSAVEINGRAILVCGKGGGGKSTLAAAMIGQGAKLISDDLSVIEALHLLPGRRSMKLHERALGLVAGEEEPRPTGHGKFFVVPPRVAQGANVRLAEIVILGAADGVPEVTRRAQLVMAQLFRPALMRDLPDHRQRLATLLGLSVRTPVTRQIAPADTTLADYSRRAETILKRHA